jgi:hypothetical protein
MTNNDMDFLKSQEASIKKIKTLLPKDASLIAYLSPRGMLAWVKNIATTLMPPGMLGEIPEFPETTAIGFSAKMVPGGLETELVVPAELPKVIKEYVERVRHLLATSPSTKSTNPPGSGTANSVTSPVAYRFEVSQVVPGWTAIRSKTPVGVTPVQSKSW